MERGKLEDRATSGGRPGFASTKHAFFLPETQRSRPIRLPTAYTAYPKAYRICNPNAVRAQAQRADDGGKGPGARDEAGARGERTSAHIFY